MPPPDEQRLARALLHLPRRFPGPGGAAAVLRAGVVIAENAWGFADAERRLPYTRATLHRMCSITKQFTCATMLAAIGDGAALDGAIRARLPRLAAVPGAAALAHNQSGLRDYWAIAMLLGARATDRFGPREAAATIGAAASLQFEPGTASSYSNGNFRLLSDALEDVTGQDFATLLRRHVFEPAGMETALLAADTVAMPDGTTGYEGTVATGHVPAANRLLWTGDAGLGASLADMIAWECFIDRTRDDADGLYRRLSAPVTFADGTPAAYGFGLARSTECAGRAATGHGGALRGWRSHRLHFAAERVSVVVMFNHMSDARAAALELAAALFGTADATPDATLPAPASGTFVERATGLSARLEPARPGELRLRYGHGPELLHLGSDGGAFGAAGLRLEPAGGGAWRLRRPAENRVARLEPHEGALDPAGLPGRWLCRDYPGAALDIADAGGALHAAFTGPLGAGRMEPLEPLGPDLLLLPCHRALDHTPPGDWTILVHRDAAGVPNQMTVGCWLARDLRYHRES